jgi:cysteinyl-tRNA synthetase
MSKSLGNLVFVHDLLDRHDPLVVRRFLLRRRYSEDWDFEEGHLDREGQTKAAPTGDGSWAGNADRAAFFNALDDNMNTPAALRIYERVASSSDAEARAFADEAREILGL